MDGPKGDNVVDLNDFRRRKTTTARRETQRQEKLERSYLSIGADGQFRVDTYPGDDAHAVDLLYACLILAAKTLKTMR